MIKDHVKKSQDLRIEVERLREKKATVVSVVVGALGAISKDLEKQDIEP